MIFCSRCGRLQNDYPTSNEYRMDAPSIIVHHYVCECGNDIESYEFFVDPNEGWINNDVFKNLKAN